MLRTANALAIAFVLSGVVANAQTPATGFGAPCTPGQYSHGGYLLVCSSAGTFRYALREDVPPAPQDGYQQRPSWYPRLNEIFRATNPPACPLAGRVTFTSPPIRVDDLLTTVPQGAMVGDHVTPIDHGYIGIKSLAKARAERSEADYVRVSSSADAEVIEISLLGSPTSIRVVLAHGCDTYSVFMVLNRLSGALGHLQDDLQAQQRLSPRIRLLAGEEFGEQRDNPLDFSVHVGDAWLPGFASPFSYAEGEAWKPYTIDPWPNFAPDLQQAYENTLQRVSSPRWGRIDQDVAGAASGNWFVDGTVGYSGRSVEAFRSATTSMQGGPVAGKNSYSWSHLAIARHWVQPQVWMLSVGWWKDDKGDPVQWLIDRTADQPEPSQLTTTAGPTVYRLRRWEWSTPPSNESPQPIDVGVVPGSVQGIVAIQVNADSTLTIELMPGTDDPAAFQGFSAAKRIYRR